MSTIEGLSKSFESIMESLNCAISTDPMIDAYTLTPCGHKVSEYAMKELKKKNTSLCPFDRKPITGYIKDHQHSELVQKVLDLQKDFLKYKDSLSVQTKPSKEEKVEAPKKNSHQGMELPPAVASKAEKTDTYAENASQTMRYSTQELDNLRKSFPVVLVEHMASHISKLKEDYKKNKDHSVLLGHIQYISKAFPDTHEKIFYNLLYKHAYWFTVQKKEMEIPDDLHDFGQVAITDGLLPDAYYPEIIDRATIEHFMHILPEIFSKNNYQHPLGFDQKAQCQKHFFAAIGGIKSNSAKDLIDILNTIDGNKHGLNAQQQCDRLVLDLCHSQQKMSPDVSKQLLSQWTSKQ